MIRTRQKPNENTVINDVTSVHHNLHRIIFKGPDSTIDFDEDDILAIMIPVNLE
jgi:hypothetical protein